MAHSVLLVGSGNIGRRHLEALLAAPEEIDMRISVVEPSEAARAATAKLLENAAGSSRVSGVAMHERIEDAPRAAELVIIASDAAPRRKIFDAVSAHADVGSWVFEKVLFQTRRDIDEVGEVLASKGASAFVNCGRRGFPGYQLLRDRLRGQTLTSMSVRGSHFGLACNAIHFTDLLEFVGGDVVAGMSAEMLVPGFVAAKRPGYVEVYGALTGHTKSGTQFSLDCLDTDGEPLVVCFETPSWKAVVNEGTRRIEFKTLEGDESEPFETRFVSQMPYLLTDILVSGSSLLPDYASSAAQHRLLIDALRPHLGLDNDRDDPCPIS